VQSERTLGALPHALEGSHLGRAIEKGVEATEGAGSITLAKEAFTSETMDGGRHFGARQGPYGECTVGSVESAAPATARLLDDQERDRG
jgi:hypothetical protein